MVLIKLSGNGFGVGNGNNNGNDGANGQGNFDGTIGIWNGKI